MRRSRSCICRAARRSRPARGWSPATTPRRCAASRAKGPDLLYTGALGAHLRRPHGEVRRLHHARRPDRLSHDRARRAARHLSRLRDRRAAAAVVRAAAHHPDAEHPGGLRHRRARLRLRRHAASAGRGAEDRLRRPRRRDRRSGVRQGAGGEAAVEGLRRRSPRAHRPGARAGLERRGGAGRRRAHHASDGRRRHGQHRRQHADHQLAVRRALHRAGHRHDPEQLHVRVHAASGPRQFDRAGQAHHLVDVAGDRAARRQAALRARACRAGCASSPR